VEIGLSAKAAADAAISGDALFAEDIRPLFPRRPLDAHKNLFGHLLVAAGSADYVGAPMLAAVAGLRSGCGLVTVAVPETARVLMHVPLGALIVRSVADGGCGFFSAESAAPLCALLEKAKAAVFGPGTGDRYGLDKPLKAVLDAGIPAVIDADGLRRLAKHPEWLTAKERPKDERTEETKQLVLTPHPGEMRVLLEGFGLGDRLEVPRAAQAEALACHTGACVVLKGLGTVVAAPGGRVTVNSTGNSTLATAGSGDVLAGMIGGFLAQGMPAWDAARAAVFLHGLAVELAPSGRGLVADDLPDLTKAALRAITSAA
jgi:NAD(P)H-hydrate epimerase